MENGGVILFIVHSIYILELWPNSKCRLVQNNYIQNYHNALTSSNDQIQQGTYKLKEDR